MASNLPSVQTPPSIENMAIGPRTIPTLTADEDGPIWQPHTTATLSPRTAIGILESAGPEDGATLVGSAKDLAATIRLLNLRLSRALDRAHNAEERAHHAENNAYAHERRANWAEAEVAELERQAARDRGRGRPRS